MHRILFGHQGHKIIRIGKSHAEEQREIQHKNLISKAGMYYILEAGKLRRAVKA